MDLPCAVQHMDSWILPDYTQMLARACKEGQEEPIKSQKRLIAAQ